MKVGIEVHVLNYIIYIDIKMLISKTVLHKFKM